MCEVTHLRIKKFLKYLRKFGLDEQFIVTKINILCDFYFTNVVSRKQT